MHLGAWGGWGGLALGGLERAVTPMHGRVYVRCVVPGHVGRPGPCPGRPVAGQWCVCSAALPSRARPAQPCPGRPDACLKPRPHSVHRHHMGTRRRAKPIHTYTFTYKHTHTRTHSHARIYTHTHTYIYTSTHPHTHTHILSHTHIHTRSHTYMRNTQAHRT